LTSSCCWAGAGGIDTCVLLRLKMLDIVRLKLLVELRVDRREMGVGWKSCPAVWEADSSTTAEVL
jgi:hypothetical protein